MTSRICTFLEQLYADVTSVNSFFAYDKIINNSDNFRIKCLFHSKIIGILEIMSSNVIKFLFSCYI